MPLLNKAKNEWMRIVGFVDCKREGTTMIKYENAEGKTTITGPRYFKSDKEVEVGDVFINVTQQNGLNPRYRKPMFPSRSPFKK